MNELTHYNLPENTNSLYSKEARSSIALAVEVANKINELVDAYNALSKTDLAWKQEQEGRIRGGIIYMKDNLQNALDDMMLQLKANGFIDRRIVENMREFVTKVDLVTARLNNLLGSVQAGSTTLDAELIDLRTAVNGYIYTSAGESIRNQFKSSIMSNNTFLDSNNYATQFTDANDFPTNRVIFVSADITPAMVSNLAVYGYYQTILTYSYKEGSLPGCVQIAVTRDVGMYIRINIGAENPGTWYPWNKIAYTSEIKNEINPVQHNDLIGAFQKIGVIGDSLSVGYIQDRDDTSSSARQLDYSWVSYLAKDTGAKCIHLGRSGATTRSWFTDAEGYAEFAKPANLCQAYIICLGANDVSSVALGSASDVNVSNKALNADTFYGNYAKIIQTIKEVNPKAKIFTFTMPYPRENANFNNAIKAVTAMFSGCFLVDLAGEYNGYFNSGIIKDDYVNYHYTAIGYRAIASVNKMALSNTMAKSINLFHDIDEIPFN